MSYLNILPFSDCTLDSTAASSFTPDFSTSSILLSTNDILSGRLLPYNNHLTVAHFNARSMKSPDKFAQFFNIFSGQIFTIICVTETWLDDTVSSQEVALPGYHLVRHDRLGKSGGGIAVYFCNSLSTTILDCSISSTQRYSSSPEFLILEICGRSLRTLLAVVYHAPAVVGTLDGFEECLEPYLHLYDHKFIVGDFNVNLLSSDREASHLSARFTSLGFDILPLQATRHDRDLHTLLDLILVSTIDPTILLPMDKSLLEVLIMM